MNFDVVRGKITKVQPTQSLVNNITRYFELSNDDGTLYLGYPLSASSESKVTIDALLVSKKCGLIAFIFPEERNNSDLIKEEQDTLYYHLDYNFKKYVTLKKGRNLAFKPKVVSVFPDDSFPIVDEDYILISDEKIEDVFEEELDFTLDVYKRLCESLQRVTNIKPKKKRQNVQKELSYGGKIKKIEKEIANLDQWQKKAALELPEGPQRIRGLAGSGKTIVLALKAAYLHSQYPEWNIAITFYTRALSQQIKDLIRQFSFEFSGEEPDWDKVHVVHAWGTDSEDGIYSIAARSLNITPFNFTNAKNKYGRTNAFNGICDELLSYFNENCIPKFDAILIDEAQDLPSSFFKILYQLTKKPKRITWAYDELQNLSEIAMPSLEEMFGRDKEGNLNIILENRPNEAQQDIILPICYRNPPWALSIAHALGFGLYRSNGIVQMFDELELWENIGYQRISGKLSYGSKVVLKRKMDSTPEYFIELLKPEESVQAKVFESSKDQYRWVADQIKKNIEVDELDPDDILVIFPDAYLSNREYIDFRRYLNQLEINSILAGVDTNRDTFRIINYVSCSSIYRAKGNEAPMVYILNANYCAEGYELIKLRNTLFTAITRSRGWVRICGVGEEMSLIEEEINRCANKDHTLDFILPTKKELESIRRINRERTQEEVKKLSIAQSNVKQLIEGLEKGEIDPDSLPEFEALLKVYKKLRNDNNEHE
ncbi:MAG TPA: ATP-binding domain-containing protein [Ruminiclostridium sp.]